MKEIISINIGQSGVQLANAAWELFCIEHGIRADGTMNSIVDDNDTGYETFFRATDCNYIPRAITVDFEPTVIDEVRVGAYRKLFNPDQLISGFEDCANNFARGIFTVGKSFMKPVMKQIRKQIECCDSLQGFCFLNSFDGGTGSGFTSAVQEELSVTYGKRPKYQIGIYPSRRMATSTVYPYNAIFHTHSTMTHANLNTLMDNEAIYDICSKKLEIERPTYSNLNRIIVQLFSSITISARSRNLINSDLDQLCTNLVPYPRIHFPLSHLSPLLSAHNADKESSNIADMTRDIFDEENQLVHCNSSNGRFMACVLQFRGPIPPALVNKTIIEIKGRDDINFVDWCPTGFKIGISSMPSASPPGSALANMKKTLAMLSNSTAIVEIWLDLLKKFDLLYSRRSFIHWFVGEGLEEGEFTEAYQNIKSLEKDYLEIAIPGKEGGGNKRTQSNEYSRTRSESSNNVSQEAKKKGKKSKNTDSSEVKSKNVLKTKTTTKIMTKSSENTQKTKSTKR